MKLQTKKDLFQWLGGLILLAAFLFHFVKKEPAEVKLTTPGKDPKCQTTYQNFYRNSEVEMRIVFGYKDSRPARFVGDRYERAHLVKRLTHLGFTRDSFDDDLFATQIVGPSEQLKTVKLRLVSSSAGPDDETNRKNPYQKYQSEFAEASFLNGLAQADAVFYNGHSRDGGGPDFDPPLVIPSTQHVAYYWYRTHQPGLKKMLKALNGSAKKPELIGLFSCSSSGHFGGAVHEAAQSGLIGTSSLLYYSDALEGLVQTIDGLLKMKCQADFHPLGTSLIGFFPKKFKN